MNTPGGPFESEAPPAALSAPCEILLPPGARERCKHGNECAECEACKLVEILQILGFRADAHAAALTRGLLARMETNRRELARVRRILHAIGLLVLACPEGIPREPLLLLLEHDAPAPPPESPLP